MSKIDSQDSFIEPYHIWKFISAKIFNNTIINTDLKVKFIILISSQISYIRVAYFLYLSCN